MRARLSSRDPLDRFALPLSRFAARPQLQAWRSLRHRPGRHLPSVHQGPAARQQANARRRVLAEYGPRYPEAPGTINVDDLVPLGLRGSNDLRTPWPEPAVSEDDRDA